MASYFSCVYIIHLAISLHLAKVNGTEWQNKAPLWANESGLFLGWWVGQYFSKKCCVNLK